MWFCQTEKAKKQMKTCDDNNCPGCYKCTWIETSAAVMVEYGTAVEPEEEKHPLYNIIKEKFNGKEID